MRTVLSILLALAGTVASGQDAPLLAVAERAASTIQAPLVPMRLVAPGVEDHWQLSLGSVTVEQQRERGGDRPYFAVIAFQSRVNFRRSTRVELYEREPHDWVSKPEHRGGVRLRRGDHMSSGETLRIPDWMGLHLYDPIAPTRIDDGTALAAPIIGAFVVALDNNNTPPHAVRNVLTTLRDWVEEYLVERVESGRILGDLRSPDPQAAFEASLQAFAAEAFDRLDKGRVVATLFDNVVGPLGNPDKLVGMHAFVLPAVEDFEAQTQTGAFSVPVLGENVGWTYTLAPPGEGLRRPIVFSGSDARYRVSMDLTRSRVPEAAPVSRLQIRIRTGDDDLREGSRIRATVFDTRGRRIGSGDLNRGRKWDDRSVNTVSVAIDRPVPLADVGRVELRFTSGPGMGGDDWKVDMVSVFTDTAAPPVWSRQGRPLKEFSGDDPVYTISLR